jgi:hypothetical protein
METLQMKKQMLMIAMMAALTLGFAGQAQALLGDVIDKVDDILDPYENEQPGAAVPEPSSALVFGAGLLTAAAVRRSRRKA